MLLSSVGVGRGGGVVTRSGCARRASSRTGVVARGASPVPGQTRHQTSGCGVFRDGCSTGRRMRRAASVTERDGTGGGCAPPATHPEGHSALPVHYSPVLSVGLRGRS